MSPSKNPHRVLGLAPNAEEEVIQGAYRALAMKYHPDRNAGGGQRMKEINAAYEILKDPIKRRQWELKTPEFSRPESNSTPPPPANHRGASCAHHPYGAEQGVCSSCAVVMCSSCRGWNREGKKRLCPECRAGHLEFRLLTFWGLLLFGNGLLGMLHLRRSLFLAYLVAALPSGYRLWNRISKSKNGRQIKAWLDARPLGQRQRWALTILRWVAPCLIGIFACPFELLLTAGLLAVEIWQGSYGFDWWLFKREQLLRRLQVIWNQRGRPM